MSQTQRQPSVLPPQRPTAPPPRDPRRNSGLYLPWWSLALLLVLVLIVAFGLVALLILMGNRGTVPADTTPIIRIVTAAPELQAGAPLPTSEPPPASISIPNSGAPLSLSGPTLPPIVFTPTPMPIAVGAAVEVTGVDEQLLNVRDIAAVQGSTVLFRLAEGARLTIIEGPNQGDGFTWWKVQNPLDPQQIGWAVSNYLRAVPATP